MPRSCRCRAARRVTARLPGSTGTAPVTGRGSWWSSGTGSGQGDRSAWPGGLEQGRVLGRGAQVSSVSCGAPGSCAAGGYYTGWHSRLLGFVAVERHGTWGRAVEVPWPGGPGQGELCRGQLGVLHVGGPLRGRRDLQPPGLARVRRRRAERTLGHRDPGAWPGGPEQEHDRPGQLGVLCLAGQLRRRRVLQPADHLRTDTGRYARLAVPDHPALAHASGSFCAR